MEGREDLISFTKEELHQTLNVLVEQLEKAKRARKPTYTPQERRLMERVASKLSERINKDIKF